MRTERNLNEMDHAITETEAAAYLGISKKTAQNWRTLNRGPKYIRISQRCIRYMKSDLKEYLMSKRIVPEGNNNHD